MGSYSLSHLSDQELDRDLALVIGRERTCTAHVLAHIAEFDTRKLWRPAGYASMYEYCVEKLRLSEQAALKRIRAARLARRFPIVFEAVADGRLHLSSLVLLARYLTKRNANELLDASMNKTKTQIEELLARCFPQPDVATRIEDLSPPPSLDLAASIAVPAPANGQLSPGTVLFHPTQQADSTRNSGAMSSSATPMADSTRVPLSVEQPPRSKVAPLAPKRYATQFTMSQEMHDDLRLVQELLCHQIPSRNVVEVLHFALKCVIRERQSRKHAATTKPRAIRSDSRPSANPRYIPANVRRAVHERDRDQCTFVSEDGRRCSARGSLEYDHIEPVARGGGSTVENLRLRCRAHNQFEAERMFGTGFMENKREQARQASGALTPGP